MSSWSMGYMTDTLYTFGYYQELNPLRAKFIFNQAGLAFPDMKSGYACELGFGQGVSINIHANASTTTWYGNDFNPSQVNFARHLAQKGAANIHLFEESFGEFVERDDLPKFDYIALHGIWSWISRENQDFIVEFIKKNLKVGGVVYISYNVSPGFMTFEPVRQLMAEFSKNLVAPKLNVDEKLKAIRGFIESVIRVNPAVLQNNPMLPQRIQTTFTKDSHYVFAEYCNDFWHIIHFSDMVKDLDHAKLSFACSATGTEHLDNINLTPDQQQFLASLRGTPLYESTRDFIVNQQFRRDFFVRGPMQLSASEQEAALNATHFILATPVDDFNYQLNTRLGTANLKREVYEPLFNAMHDYKTHSLAELTATLTAEGKLKASEVYEAVRTLALFGILAVALPENEIDADVVARCQKLNRDLLSDIEIANINYLASPVTQGGFAVSDVTRKLLQAYLFHNKESEADLIAYITDELKRTGSTLNKQGKPVTSEKEQHKILEPSVTTFLNEALPLYRSLKLI